MIILVKEISGGAFEAVILIGKDRFPSVKFILPTDRCYTKFIGTTGNIVALSLAGQQERIAPTATLVCCFLYYSEGCCIVFHWIICTFISIQ